MTEKTTIKHYDVSEQIILSSDEIEEIREQLVLMDAELSRLLAEPLVYATVVRAENKFDVKVFEMGDRLLVMDKELRREKKMYGKLASEVDAEGWVIIEYPLGGMDRVNIGLNGAVPQVKILGKDDGTNVVITLGGGLYEVHGLPGTFFNPSDTVKVDMGTKQIHP